MTLGRSIVLGICVTVSIAACSSDESSRDRASPTSAEAQSFNEQYCDIVGACCPKYGRPYAQSTCVGLFSEPAGATFDAAAGSACISAIKAASAEPRFCNDLGQADNETFEPCANVYRLPTTGTKQLGQACSTGTECVPSAAGVTECAPLADGSMCRLLIHAKENDPCDGVLGAGQVLLSANAEPTKSTIAICWNEDGLFCSSQTKKCTKQLAIGATCSAGETAPCVRGAQCDPKTNECVAMAAIGTACTPADLGDTTASGVGCDFTKTYCDDASRTCTAVLAVGAPCTANKQCGQNALCTNGKCQGGALVNTQVCGN